MSKASKWLELAEYSSLGGIIVGTVATTITKQFLYSFTPFAFAFFVNYANFKKYKNESLLLYQTTKGNVETYQKENIELKNILIEKQYQDNELLQGLIAFADEYKYRKLELESLIEKAIVQKTELDNKLNQHFSNSQLVTIFNRLSNLENEKSQAIKEIQSELQDIDNEIKKLKNSDKNSDIVYESSFGRSSLLAGLTQYYSLPGLTQRLLNEAIENEKKIEYKNKYYQKSLTEKSLKNIQRVVTDSRRLAEIVIDHYNDHGCSKEDAIILSKELILLAAEISVINSFIDLNIIYQVINLFTYQISRFQHRKSKYRWNNFMKHNMLNVLNDCLIAQRT